MGVGSIICFKRILLIYMGGVCTCPYRHTKIFRTEEVEKKRRLCAFKIYSRTHHPLRQEPRNRQSEKALRLKTEAQSDGAITGVRGQVSATVMSIFFRRSMGYDCV